MWIAFKYNHQEYDLLKENLKQKIGDHVKFYNPKIGYFKIIKSKQKRCEKYILQNYAFCYFEKFKEKNFLNKISNIKGLSYFLNGHIQQQKEIVKFINFCASNESEDGTLSSSFFSKLESKRAQFISGPFANLFFDIIEKKKNKLKILLGGIVTTIDTNSNILYHPV